jgi:DNA-binding FadR family transcriptional regulator
LAATRATEADQSRLADLAQKLDVSRLTRAYIDHDAAVHRAIYAAAHNPYLEATLNQYANPALRIWHYALHNLGPNLPPACKQDEVVAAILARDGERTKAAAEAHLREYSVEVRRLLLLDPNA